MLLFDRGFVAEVRCTLATWRGGDCERCRGERWVGSTTRGIREQCLLCRGSGTTPGIGGQVMARWPVEVVRATCREPAPMATFDGTRSGFADPVGSKRAFWFRLLGISVAAMNQHHLPTEVFDALEGGTHMEPDTNAVICVFASLAHAHAALSAVLIAEAKDRSAKLAPTVR